jgi:hypothetical protein
MMTRFLGVTSLALASGFLLPSFAPASARDGDVEPEVLERLVESLAETMEERYVFEDVGHEIGAHLRQQLWNGAYEGLSLDELTGLLTRDLRSVNDDRHLGARRLPERDESAPDPDPEERRRQWLEQARSTNFGFQKIEILDGNVGYLDLRGFSDPTAAGDTAVAAMAFLANADSIVIDLRRNGGGDPKMIQLLSSYFFAEPTHLNSFFMRGQEQLDQFWTLPHVPGKKMVDTPLYVLTSRSTFSAAEEFTYNMKNLERATIIGETTGGGAHPGGTHEIEGLITVFIPDGRAINPITETNWEGTGVEPHVSVPSTRALEVALEQIRSGSTGE